MSHTHMVHPIPVLDRLLDLGLHLLRLEDVVDSVDGSGGGLAPFCRRLETHLRPGVSLEIRSLVQAMDALDVLEDPLRPKRADLAHHNVPALLKTLGIEATLEVRIEVIGARRDPNHSIPPWTPIDVLRHSLGTREDLLTGGTENLTQMSENALSKPTTRQVRNRLETCRVCEKNRKTGYEGPGAQNPAPTQTRAERTAYTHPETRLLQSSNEKRGVEFGLCGFVSLLFGVLLQRLVLARLLDVEGDAADGVGVVGDDAIGEDEILKWRHREVVHGLGSAHHRHEGDFLLADFSIRALTSNAVTDLELLCPDLFKHRAHDLEEAVVLCHDDEAVILKQDLVASLLRDMVLKHILDRHKYDVTQGCRGFDEEVASLEGGADVRCEGGVHTSVRGIDEEPIAGMEVCPPRRCSLDSFRN